MRACAGERRGWRCFHLAGFGVRTKRHSYGDRAGKFGRPEQLHVAFEALGEFEGAHGRAPALHDAADAAAVVAAAGTLVAAGGRCAGVVEAVDADVVTKVAALARVELPALAAFFGGIIAQVRVRVVLRWL